MSINNDRDGEWF